MTDQIKQRLAGAGLQVKPLEWREWPRGEEWSTSVLGFKCSIREDKGAFWLRGGRWVLKRFLTLAAAQKEAQADYERRIYDALMEDAHND